MNATANGPTTVSANTTSMPWRFYVDGEAYLNDAVLNDLWDGVRNWGYAYIEGCTINAWGTGVYSYGDCHVGNTTINVKQERGPGFNVYGVNARYGEASLHNLDINIDVDINYVINSSYLSNYYYTYGIYLYSADVGILQPHLNADFSIDIDIDISLESFYDTTSYVRFYHRFYTRAFYFSGDSVVKGVNNIDLNIDEDVFCAAYNATMGAYIYVYNYQEYLYSSIGANGHAPVEISGMTFTDMGAELTTAGEIYMLREYNYNEAILFYDRDGSRPGDTITSLHDLTFSNSALDRVIRFPEYGEWSMTDCTFSNLTVWRVLEYYYGDLDYYMGFNTFQDIKASGDYTQLIYVYRPSGEGVITNNTFIRIEGWRLFHVYYSDDRIYFENNVLTQNIQWDKDQNPSESWFWWQETQDKITMSGNSINNSVFPIGMMKLEWIRDKFLMENNDITDNTFGDYMFWSYYNYGAIDFVDNDASMNMGPLFEFEQNRARITVSDNRFEKNAVGADYLIYCFRNYNELKFADNEFNDNSVDGMLIYFRGVNYYSNIEFTFDRNTLDGNTASSALNGGLVVFRGTRYDTAVRRNIFSNNVGNCINFYRPYTRNSWYTGDSYTFTVDGNTFRNNDGIASQFVDFRSYDIEVKRNIGTGNTGPLAYHTLTDRYVYDRSDPYTEGEMTGANSIDINTNNYSYNHGGAVDINPAQWVDANTPYNNGNQAISLRNNIFQHNGNGWAIRIIQFGNFPLLHNNDFWGSAYGVFLYAIDYPGRWEMVTMTFNGENFDGGGPAGMTAWGLVNVNAVFTDCNFTNYQEALYARDCQIDVYWSGIPEGSGRTEGRGYIYVWNNLEVHIQWADAMGMNSGQPAAGATLAMLGTNGRYYGALKADADGIVGPLLVMPWSSIEGKMDQWAPYDGTIISGGLTAHYVIHVIGEQVGDNALHLLLTDNVVPEVVVTSPSMGSMSNMVDLPVEGFLFETGSGIVSFMGYLDGGDGIEVGPEQTWMAMFNDLPQGEHTIFFEAIDVAGNRANATVTFLIDAVAPELDVVSPEDGDVTRDPNLLVQGSYQDDVSDISDIAVRVNGDLIASTTGVITEYITLTEGVNTIIIDAIDLAGNVQAVQRIVTLDTYPPTLYVYAPLHELVTSDDVLMVNGLSEAGTPILIEQVRASDGGLESSVTVDARLDGTFRTDIDLIEGGQHLVFTAEDPAGNVVTITRTVMLDTTPPGLQLTSPTEGLHVNEAVVSLVGQVDDDNPEDVRVIVNGLEIEHNVVFNRDIPLVEGINTIVVIAFDLVDNQAVRTVNVTRDTIAPELVVENPEFILTNTQTLLVRGGVDDDEAIVTVVGGIVNVDEDLKFTYEVDLAQEDAPIMVTATDKAGNSVFYAIDFVYDDEKPEILFQPPPKATTDQLVIMLNGTITDNEDTIISVSVRGDTYPVIDSWFHVLLTVDTSGNGWNNFTVSAEDEAGNVAIKKVNIEFIPGEGEKEKEVEEESFWWYYGILLFIAAVVIIATVFVFASRGDEE
jgi:hypothetical protein